MPMMPISEYLDVFLLIRSVRADTVDAVTDEALLLASQARCSKIYIHMVNRSRHDETPDVEPI